MIITGRKYDSLHLCTDKSSEDMVAAIDSCISAEGNVPQTNVELAAAQLGLNLCQQQLSLLNQIVHIGLSEQAKPTASVHDGFVSIRDARVTFENILSIAQRLSAVLSTPVFFASVYDDDLFHFGLCENGETVSVHTSGACEVYGMVRANYNTEAMEEYLSNYDENVPKLCKLQGRDFESALIKALGFQLDV